MVVHRGWTIRGLSINFAGFRGSYRGKCSVLDCRGCRCGTSPLLALFLTLRKLRQKRTIYRLPMVAVGKDRRSRYTGP